MNNNDDNKNYVEMPDATSSFAPSSSKSHYSSHQNEEHSIPNNNHAHQQQQQQQHYVPPLPPPPPPQLQLTASEIEQLRLLLARPEDVQNTNNNNGYYYSLNKSQSNINDSSSSRDSDYPEFGESTHAWAVFADNPAKRAGPWERLVGTLIILFQLFAYRLFAAEAIGDFQSGGQVPLLISHQNCIALNNNNDNIDDDDQEQEQQQLFQCQAAFTNRIDAFVAFSMLGIFLSADMLQAGRAIRNNPWGWPKGFALLAGMEVAGAFVAASIAVSYHLFIGEVTDAVEVGVGLLFIRELSQQTYRGIRYGKSKQFRDFFLVLSLLVTLGMVMDPLTAQLFAGYVQ